MELRYTANWFLIHSFQSFFIKSRYSQSFVNGKLFDIAIHEFEFLSISVKANGKREIQTIVAGPQKVWVLNKQD